MNENSTQTTNSNLAYQDFNALQLRLDTQKLHKDIWNFLQGKTQLVIFDEQKQQYIETDVDIGKPLANNIGIQNILSFVVSVANSHTIQGNTDKNELYEILYFINIHLGQQLTLNCSLWGIDKKNRRHILNTIVTMTQLVLSRTIDNLERKGLAPLIERNTQVIQSEKKGII